MLCICFLNTAINNLKKIKKYLYSCDFRVISHIGKRPKTCSSGYLGPLSKGQPKQLPFSRTKTEFRGGGGRFPYILHVCISHWIKAWISPGSSTIRLQCAAVQQCNADCGWVHNSLNLSQALLMKRYIYIFFTIT